MDLIGVAKIELIKRGMKPEFAESFAKSFLIGFTKELAEAYGKQKWKEGAAAQREICKNTDLLQKYGTKLELELAKSIQAEVVNCPEPDYK